MTEIHEQVRKHLQSSAEMQQRGQIQGGLKMRELASKCGGIFRPLPIKSSNTHGPDLSRSQMWLKLGIPRVSKDKDAILGSMPHHLNQS